MHQPLAAVRWDRDALLLEVAAQGLSGYRIVVLACVFSSGQATAKPTSWKPISAKPAVIIRTFAV